MRHGRRAFLATCGSLLAGVAGCSELDGGGSTPTAEPEPTTTPTATATATPTATPEPVGPELDGYPSADAIESVPEAADADRSSFPTRAVEGVDVPLVPIDVAYDWYRRREARFADARSQRGYRLRHIAGAVHSPALDEIEEDPALAWPKDDLIVTYCACPYHLSTIRGSRLIQDGYTQVYALDAPEGFLTWYDREYPTAGEADQISTYSLRGRTDPADAGGRALATHEPSGQVELTDVQSGGDYAMDLHWNDLSDTSPITVRTPSYEITRPLADVTTGVITPP